MLILQFHGHYSNIQLFGRVCKVTRIDYHLRHVCPSALTISLSAWNTWAPIEKSFMKFGITGFSKICREYSSLIKS